MKTAFYTFALLTLTVCSVEAQRRSKSVAPTTTPAPTTTAASDSTKPTASVRKSFNAPAFRSIDTTKTAMKMRVRKDEKGTEQKQAFRRRGNFGNYGGNRPPVYNGNWTTQCNQFGNMGAGMLDAMTQFANSTMLSAEQIFQLATLIPDEPNRLLFVQNAFHNCYDAYQYEALMPLFAMPVYIRQFDDFLYDNLYEPYGNTNGYNWNNTAGGYNNNNNGYGNNYNNNNGYGNGYNNGYGNGYNNGYNDGASYVMNDRDFMDALRAIGQSPFDETRLQTAKQITSINQLSVEQIKQVCSRFTFEDNRLDFAKFAYSRCADPHNYFKVGEVFTFDNSRSNLTAFMMSNPPRPTGGYQNQGNGYGYGNGNNGNNGNNGYNDGYSYNSYNNNQGGNQGGGRGGNQGGGSQGNQGGGRGGNRGNDFGDANDGRGGRDGRGGQTSSPAASAPQAASDADFNQIEASLKAVGVESYRRDQAKTIANTRYFTAAQIRRLCRLMNVESYKLDLAKHCYSRCTDRQNYFILNDVFSVSSYVRDLSEFTAKQ